MKIMERWIKMEKYRYIKPTHFIFDNYNGEDEMLFLKSVLISTHELGSSIIFSGSASTFILKTVDFSFI